MSAPSTGTDIVTEALQRNIRLRVKSEQIKFENYGNFSYGKISYLDTEFDVNFIDM
jgi:hypothetical protein